MSKNSLGTKAEITLDVFPTNINFTPEILREKIFHCAIDGVEWKFSEEIKVAFGVKKLRVVCVALNDISVDDITDKLKEHVEGGIQNIETVVIRNV